MTRETKVGLVISSTFLCLVAVVAYRQLQEGTDPEPSVYAKADGSPPDIPEEPAPTRPEPAKHNTSPVNAIPAFAKVDDNVKPAVATDAAPAPATTGTQAPPSPAAPPSTSPAAGENAEANKVRENNRHKLDGPLSGSPTPLTPPAPAVDSASTSPFGPRPKPEPTTPDKPTTPGLPTSPSPTPSNPTVAPAPSAVDAVPSPAPVVAPTPDATGGAKPLVSPVTPPGPSSVTPPVPESGGTGSTLPTPTVAPTAPAPLPGNPVPLPAAPEPRGSAGTSGAPTNPAKADLTASPTPAAPTSPGTGSPSSALPAAPMPADPGKTTPTAPAAPTPPVPEPSSPFAPVSTTGQGGPASSTGTPGAAPLSGTGSSTPAPASPAPEPKPATKLFDPVQGPGSPAPAPGPASATIPDSRSTPTPPQPGPGTDPQGQVGPATPPLPPADQFAQASVKPTPDAATAPASSRPLPPVGAPAAASSPPIAVPAGPGGSVRTTTVLTPQVESYDEETFYCKAPFLTFESISKKFYNSENYAQALLLFNRNHPRRAAALWKDPPVLQDDMPVYIPPLRILEKHYSYAIKDYNPLPPAGAAATGTSLSSPRGGALYVVRKPELIRTIAQATLGNWERWTEIYTLNNRSFDPSQFVPVGTQLALPADARIPPENKP